MQICLHVLIPAYYYQLGLLSWDCFPHCECVRVFVYVYYHGIVLYLRQGL